MKAGLIIVVQLLMLAVVLPSFAAGQYSVKANAAVSWLTSNQNIDGSWGKNDNLKLVYTAEAVMALEAMNQRIPAYYWGVTWLENHAAPSVDYTARRILALASHKDYLMADKSYLHFAQSLFQQTYKGWGLSRYYQSSTMDSALAIMALTKLGTTLNVQAGVDYLRSVQLAGTDKGWAVAQESVSDPITTALVIQALVGFSGVDIYVVNGVASLKSSVATTSPVNVQALAALAYLRANYAADAAVLLDHLATIQRYDGSWSGDVYSTALVIRAMAAAMASDISALEATVFIPDPNLRAAINKSLGRNSMDALTKGDLANLVTLNAEGKGITNLTGLEYAVNLTSADLRNNHITSTVPIANLNIAQLQLSGNPLYTASSASIQVAALSDASPLPAAPPDKWVGIGPQGGHFVSLVIAPTAPGRVYAGTWNGGMYKSADGGASWQSIAGGLPLVTVSSLAVSPIDADVIYAGGTGVYKTADGGATWQPLPLDLVDSTVVALAIDPNASQVVYAGTDRGAIFKSTDGGAEWISLGNWAQEYGITCLLVSPFSSDVLFAGTSQGVVLKSADAGARWLPAENGIATAGAIESLAADSSRPGVVYVASAGGVFKTMDDGVLWHAVNVGLPVDASGTVGVRTVALDAAQSDSVYAALIGGGIFKSVDGGAEWKVMNTNGLSTGAIRSMALETNHPATIFVGASFDGIGKFVDGGSQWEMVNSGLANIFARSFAVDPVDASVMYLGAHKLFKSNNGGATWSAIGNEQLPEAAIDSLAVDPFNSSVVWVGGAKGVYLSSDSGSLWTRVGGLPVDFAGVVMKFDPVQQHKIFLGGNSGLLVTTNDGADWTSLFSADQVTALVLDPLDPNKLAVGTNASGVCTTATGGSGWNCTSSGWPSVNNLPAKVTSLQNDVFDSSVLYAGTTLGVYKSADAGASWSLSYGKPGDCDTTVSSLAMDALQPPNLLAVISRSVIKSADGGLTWSAVEMGGLRGVDKIQTVPSDSSTAYGLSLGEGLFRWARQQ